MQTLAEMLDGMTQSGVLFDTLDRDVVQCKACAHRCRIAPGRRGKCQVRWNKAGILQVPAGYVAALNLDPIEKKPFDHFLPGAAALTFGMLGCNMTCDFCQNWPSSQALRDPAARHAGSMVQRVTAAQVVETALRSEAQIIASSYNEPLISSEWAVEIFRLAKEQGLKTVMISNGMATPEALEYLHPCLDGLKVDLKTMNAEQYRSLGGDLDAVLDTIKLAREMGLWVEVVTLVIPGFNDSTDELWQAARFLAGISSGIPWHVTAFHPDYQRLDSDRTPAETLMRAAEIGEEAGLHFIYAGNLPGRVGSLEDTRCPHCQARLVHRQGYHILENCLGADGKCPECGETVPGVWG